MTEQKHDKHRGERHDLTDGKLEALYREAGDVEPDSGLDRIVQARADDASRTGRSSARLPWLSGLATASVAIVAIAVVLQQAPPGEPMPESPAPRQADEADAYMAPSMGARPQLSADSGRSAPELRDRKRPSTVESDSPERSALSNTAAESRQPDTLAERELAAPTSRVQPARERVPAADLDLVELESVDAVIEKLRELINVEQLDQARRLLDEATQRHPQLDLPDDIERVLSERDLDATEPDPQS